MSETNQREITRTICVRCEHHFERGGHRCRLHRLTEIQRDMDPVTGELIGRLRYTLLDGSRTAHEYGPCGDYNAGNCPDFHERVPIPMPAHVPLWRRVRNWLGPQKASGDQG